MSTVIPFNRGQQPRGIGSLVSLDHAISKGATGADVRDLQRQLYAWGFDTGAFDGVYGPKTTAAVQQLQKILRLPQDGVFGPNTLAAVNADLAQPRSMLNDREAQNINRPPPPPASVTPQAPPQLNPAAIVPASATVTSASAEEAKGGYWGVPMWAWLLVTGLAVTGLVFAVKGEGGGLHGEDEDTDNFFDHDDLLGAPQPKKRARRRKEEEEDELPDDTEDEGEDGGDGGDDGGEEDTEDEGEE